MKHFGLLVSTLLLLFCCALSCTKNDKPSNIEKSVEKESDSLPEETIKVPELDGQITASDFDKGKNISSFKMKSLKTGEEVSFGNYKGKRILVDFWASWCEPCIEMFPLINRLKKEYEEGKQNLKILTVSIDPMPNKIKQIIKEKNVEFEVLQATETLAQSGILMPYMVIADETGKVVLTSSGTHTYEELVTMINGK